MYFCGLPDYLENPARLSVSNLFELNIYFYVDTIGQPNVKHELIDEYNVLGTTSKFRLIYSDWLLLACLAVTDTLFIEMASTDAKS